MSEIVRLTIDDENNAEDFWNTIENTVFSTDKDTIAQIAANEMMNGDEFGPVQIIFEGGIRLTLADNAIMATHEGAFEGEAPEHEIELPDIEEDGGPEILRDQIRELLANYPPISRVHRLDVSDEFEAFLNFKADALYVTSQEAETYKTMLESVDGFSDGPEDAIMFHDEEIDSDLLGVFAGDAPDDADDVKTYLLDNPFPRTTVSKDAAEIIAETLVEDYPGDFNRLEAEGGKCHSCNVEAELRTCEYCDAEAWIIDCGCLMQPRPIAADEDGSGWICEDCYDEREKKESPKVDPNQGTDDITGLPYGYVGGWFINWIKDSDGSLGYTLEKDTEENIVAREYKAKEKVDEWITANEGSNTHNDLCRMTGADGMDE